MSDEIICDFPVRGIWNAPNTPGDKIPSHGTDALGQTYAIDLWRTCIDDVKKPFEGSLVSLYTFGLKIGNFFCYNENIFSPFNGVVVDCYYQSKEPKGINPIWEIIKFYSRIVKSIATSLIVNSVDQIDLTNYIGNFVILKIEEDKYCLFAHLSAGTYKLKVGEQVKKNQLIGNVGHTGNSTSPHLHFQLMNSNKIITSRGLSFKFTDYEIFENATWHQTTQTIPKSNQIIRKNA